MEHKIQLKEEAAVKEVSLRMKMICVVEASMEGIPSQNVW